MEQTSAAARSSRDLSPLTMNGELLIPLSIMDLGLKGKRALVTGSTAGIGLATAELLAREGASVIVNGRTAERVDAAVRRIRDAAPGAAVTGVAADVGSAAGCDAVIAAQPELDVLVNNLGIFEPKPFEQITDAE